MFFLDFHHMERQINENTSGTTWFDGTLWLNAKWLNESRQLHLIADGINSNYENHIIGNMMQIQFLASSETGSELQRGFVRQSQPNISYVDFLDFTNKYIYKYVAEYVCI